MRNVEAPPTVTIITPSLNQGDFLAQALESVASQNAGTVQHLVYDAGSTDSTLSVLARYSDRVTAVVEADGGQAAAVNRGLREADGEIVGWLNSDDFYYPEAIQTVVDYMGSHPECEVLYGDACYVDENGKVVGPYPTGDPDDLVYGCFICQPTVFLRRSAIDAVGPLDDTLRYCMDYEWWLRIRDHIRLHRVPHKLAAYRLHGQSKSVAEQLESRREVVQMTRRRLGATPLTCLYGYANFLTRERLGVALDDGVPLNTLGRVLAAGASAALALRYHPRPTRDDFRLLMTRLGRGRAVAPGDFSAPGSP